MVEKLGIEPRPCALQAHVQTIYTIFPCFFAIINYNTFLKLGQILMDQVMGIEPIPSPWQGDILPLNYTWISGSYRAAHSSFEYFLISVTRWGNPSALHHFLMALSLTPNCLPIETKLLFLINIFSSSLLGLSDTL